MWLWMICMYIHEYIEVELLNMKLSKVCAKINSEISNKVYRGLSRNQGGWWSIVRAMSKGITSNLTLPNSSSQIPWIKKYYMEGGKFITKGKPIGYKTKSKPIGYKTKSKPIGYKTKNKPIGYTNEKKANRLCKWKESQSALQMKRKNAQMGKLKKVCPTGITKWVLSNRNVSFLEFSQIWIWQIPKWDCKY